MFQLVVLGHTVKSGERKVRKTVKGRREIDFRKTLSHGSTKLAWLFYSRFSCASTFLKIQVEVVYFSAVAVAFRVTFHSNIRVQIISCLLPSPYSHTARTSHKCLCTVHHSDDIIIYSIFGF
jgi:hypothetical protein